jgi:tRNA G10  N-methylase Trm11
MNLENLSLTELKQLLSCVNQDIKAIKRKENAAKKEPVLSELAECNIIAQRFTKNVVIENVENKKIKQDIQIQRDILDYLNNGGHIITRKSRKKIKPLSVVSYHKVSL